MISTKIIITFFIFTILLIQGCSSADSEERVSSADSTSSDTSQNKRPGFGDDQSDNKAIPVEVTDLTSGEISSFLLFSATLETEQTVQVYARVGGLVEQIYVDEGDPVKKGQALLQIEDDEYSLNEQDARVNYQKQQSNFDRMKALQAEMLMSQEEFETAELNMKQAKIAWERTRLTLDYSTVRSPVKGVVGDRSVNLGDLIPTSQVLFSVANLAEKIVRVYVPQTELNNCYKGQYASIVSDVVPNRRFEGHVKRISPVIDPQSGTFKVTIAVRDAQNTLRPGMFVNTRLIVDTHSEALLLPKTALIRENDRSFFFVADGDSCRRVELKKGFEDAEKVELLNNDLALGAKIVVLGQSGLKDGSKIRITDEKVFSWQGAAKDEKSAGTM